MDLAEVNQALKRLDHLEQIKGTRPLTEEESREYAKLRMIRVSVYNLTETDKKPGTVV